MVLHFIVGLFSLIAGLTLMVVGTDYGRILNVTIGVLMGSVLVIIGLARLKYAWVNRKGDDETN